MSARLDSEAAPAPMVVDAYSHVCPVQLMDAVDEVNPSSEATALRRNTFLFDMERRIDYMDRVGVDMHVLVLVRPPMWLGMERKDVHRLTRIANEGIAELAATHPDRFVGVGVLPVVDEATMREFEYAWADLGLRGVLIFSNVEGEPIDAPEMWQLYERAAALDCPIWIHPQHGPYYPWIKRDLLDRLFGWPFETTLAMARLVYGGVFERFPEIKFVTHHMGGMLPFYGGRAERFHEDVVTYARAGIGEQSNAELSGSILDHFKRFYCDSNVSGSDDAFRCGLEFFGADHIMFGSDFPMGTGGGEPWANEVLAEVRDTPLLDEKQRDLVLGQNAVRLLKLAAQTQPGARAKEGASC